jgi:TP901 family phage tail tape measure protein
MTERVETIRLTAQVSNYLAGMRQSAIATDYLGTQAEKLALKGQAFANLGRSLTLFGGIVAAGVVVAVKSFADFDAQMAQVKTLSHATGDEMLQLASAAETLGQKIGISAREAADAELELVKAGISVKDILGGALQGSLQLAAAGQIDVASATEIATIALTQFKLKGQDVPHVADLLAAGADKALGGVNDLGEALKSGGLVASQFGISLDDTVGVLSAFANAGLLGETAGTDLRQMLLKLANPSAESAAALKKLGINIYDTSGKFVGLTALAGQLHDKLGDATQATRNSALAVIFGSRAIAGANVLYAEGAKGIGDWISKVNDSGFAAHQAAGKMDNLEGDISKLGAAFQKDLIESGSSANDVLREAVQILTALVQGFGSLPQPVLGGALAVGAVVAALALMSGLTLSAIPKIAELRVSMTALGLSGKGAAIGIGAASIALLAIGALLTVFATRAATAASNTSEFKDTLDASTGSLTKYTRELVIKKLAEDGSYEAARKAGVSQKQLTDAVIEGGDALKKTTDKLNDFSNFHAANPIDAINIAGTSQKVYDLNQNLGESKRQWKDSAAAAGDSSSSTDTAAAAYENAATQAQNLSDQISSLVDEINKANGVGQDAVTTNADYQKALVDATKSVNDYIAAHGKSAAALDETTAAGSANAAMLANLAKKNEDAAAAQFALDGNTSTYLATLTAGHAAVVAQAEALGATAAQAQAIADKIATIPSATQVKVLVDASQASSALAGIHASINSLASKYSISVSAKGSFATGGYTGNISPASVAGVVHGREFVSTASTTANPNNRAALEYMQGGGVIRGYAGGGYVTPSYVTPAYSSSSGSDSGPLTALVDPAFLRAVRQLAEAHRLSLDEVGLSQATQSGSGRRATLGAS